MSTLRLKLIGLNSENFFLSTLKSEDKIKSLKKEVSQRTGHKEDTFKLVFANLTLDD
jgi:hypothetical protein